MIVAAGLTAEDVRYKRTLPKLLCAKPMVSKQLTLSCGYTLDYVPKVMMLSYTATNNQGIEQTCTTGMQLGKERVLLSQNVVLKPFETKRLEAVFPYPTKDVTLHLIGACGSRSISSMN